MSDFETHPAGTAARIAELEAGRVNPESVAGLVEAARKVMWGATPRTLDGLRKALAALEQEPTNG